jgi:hypothetical protein
MRVVWTLSCLLFLALDLSAADPRWERYAACEPRIRALNPRLHELGGIVARIGETVQNPELQGLRAAFAEGETKLKEAIVTSGLTKIEAEYMEGAGQRDRLIDAHLGDSAPLKESLSTLQAAKKIVEELRPRVGSLSPEEALRYAEARHRETSANTALYYMRSDFFAMGGEKMHALYKQWNDAKSRDKTVSAAQKAFDGARKTLAAAEQKAGRSSPLAAPLVKEEEEINAKAKAIREEMDALANELRGKWDTFSGKVTQKPEKPADKPRDWPCSVSIPKGCVQIKGAMIAGGVANDPCIQSVLAASSFAIVQIQGIYVMNTPMHREIFETALATLTAQCGHPELAHVPWLTGGTSASVITARNIAAWRPERAVGVIHFAGGNLHHMRDIGKPWSLAGIPLLAINGEKESCGPEGGIRTEYGRLTQWVMIREQLLRFRAHSPDHFMSLIVIPEADHAGWSSSMSHLVAEFVQQAILARVPEQPEPAKATVICRTIRPDSGWLADADFCQPRHPPAPVSRYAGKPADAFWHFNEYLAAGIESFHRGRLMPDPTRKHPVPADWPPAPAPRP